MITVKLIKPITAKPEAVISLLLEHGKLDRFFNASFVQTRDADEGEIAGGAGSIRKVTMRGQTFLEQIIAASERHITYKIIGDGPVSQHRGDIHAQEHQMGTVLHYTIICKAPWWQPNWLVKMVIKRDISRGLDKLAASFGGCHS